MTKSEFLKILEKQSQTYRNYGNDMLADEIDFVIEIAKGLDEPTERKAVLSVPHDNS